MRNRDIKVTTPTIMKTDILVFDIALFEDQPWASEGRKRVNIWIPLGAALKPFEDLVIEGVNS